MSDDPSTGASDRGRAGGTAEPPPYRGGYGQVPGYGQASPGGYGPPPEPDPVHADRRGRARSGPPGPARSVVSALGDPGFTRFATPVVVQVVYVLGTIVIALGWTGALAVGFSRGLVPGVLSLVLGGLVAVFVLILLRVVLELFHAVLRMSEELHRRP
ncbi:MAG: DUF4282 domain-containing protein [Pseudonocardia sp.]|nr:DUF4282 domain-containing protein [Pseudonocardia sp.]